MSILPQVISKKHQQFNPALHWSSFNHNELGAYGEYVARWSFFKAGLIVLPCRSRKCGDFRVLDISTGLSYFIEVKTAKKHTGKLQSRWHFNLISKSTNINHANLVCLVVLDDDKHYIYLIPSSLFQSTHFSLSSHPTRYHGKFACFLQRQSWIDLDACLTTAALWSETR